MKDKLLIVDDETDLLHGLKRMIEPELGCQVLLAGSAVEALGRIKKEVIDVVLTDIRMPDMDGQALLEAVKELDPAVTVIVMTAYGTIEKAVEAIKSGAYDFIQKPLDEERLIHLLKNGFELNRLVRENTRLMQRLGEKAPFENMVGRSRPMLQVFDTVQMLAKTDVTVLIIGETGTGKELAAQAIHGLSARRKRSMVTVNCPALPESILESELFGYRRGAFTHASDDRLGLFDQAHGSTIFLDEIGDLSPAVQTKLLRVLQDKKIKPLGVSTGHEVDVRIIAATNQDLKMKMGAKQFREDLFYRLHVATLTMPPLREIRADIPLLIDHFLEQTACEHHTAKKQLAPEVMNSLLKRDWPGNIRELENTIRGWNAVVPGDTITERHLAVEAGKCPTIPDSLDMNRSYRKLKEEAIEAFTLSYLNRLLEHTGGNVTLAARIRWDQKTIITKNHKTIWCGGG